MFAIDSKVIRDTKKHLNEHRTTYTLGTDDDPPCTTCFLETTSEPFVIYLSKLSEFRDSFRAVCEIDGKDIGFQTWFSDINEYKWEEVWSQKDGILYQSSLKFDNLQTTKDPKEVNMKIEDLMNIGTISITLTLGTAKRSRKVKGIETFDPVRGVVNENNDFLSSVNTTDTAKSDEWKIPFYDFTPNGDGKPYHKFVFHYRSRPVLKFLGMIDGGNSESQRLSPYINQKDKTPLFLSAGPTPESSQSTTEPSFMSQLSGSQENFTNSQVSAISGSYIGSIKSISNPSPAFPCSVHPQELRPRRVVSYAEDDEW